MHEIVEYLCSPVCLGRNPGTDDGVATRNFLRDHLIRIGLESCGEHGFDQPIPLIGGSNLLASIPGSQDGYVMLAAHYDACGQDNPGADDNAAAVAIALTVAENLRGSDLGSTVIIALFDAEEPPHFLTSNMGSQWFVDHPTIPLGKLETMICLDLVGHSIGPEGTPDEVSESVFVLGAEKATGTGEILDALPPRQGIRPRRIDNYVVDSMSDYDAFMNAGVPFLFYTAGRTEHYHMPTDTPDRLDYTKMSALVDHLTDVVTALANREFFPYFYGEGYDDEATIDSLDRVLLPLSRVSDEALAAWRLVHDLRYNLAEIGSLGRQDRSTIRMIVDQIESALA